MLIAGAAAAARFGAATTRFGVATIPLRSSGELELIIRSVSTGEPLARLPLAAGERFTLRYIHSVDGTPVWEELYADRRGDIYIGEERFVLLGAGMGHWPGHGTLTMRDSLQAIENIDRRIGSFVMRIGDRQREQTIRCGKRVVCLSDLAPGEAVEVSAVPMSTAPAARVPLARGPARVLDCPQRRLAEHRHGAPPCVDR